jgi:hypothetical protein
MLFGAHQPHENGHHEPQQQEPEEDESHPDGGNGESL